MAKKDKGFFEKAFDSLTAKDEKEKIDELQGELDAAQEAVKSLMNQTQDSKKEKLEADQELDEARKKIKTLEDQIERLRERELERRREEHTERIREQRAQLAEQRGPEILTTHEVESNNQTLSHVALKYYGHATPPYWEYLLEHNKKVLRGSERNIRMGMELEIPDLPEDLKDERAQDALARIDRN
jgi:chromosome segregation ATPase